MVSQKCRTHRRSQHHRRVANRMPIELEREQQRRKRVVLHRTLGMAVRRLAHLPFAILRSSRVHRQIRLLQRKVNLFAVVQPAANVHRAVLRVERPPSIVGAALRLVQARRHTGDLSGVLEYAAGRLAEFVFARSYVAVENAQIGLPQKVAAHDNRVDVIVIARLPFQECIHPVL